MVAPEEEYKGEELDMDILREIQRKINEGEQTPKSPEDRKDAQSQNAPA